MSESEPQPEAKAPSDLTPQIAKRAYEIHEERGGQSDPAVQDWEQAKREIQKDATKAAPQPETETKPKPEAKAGSKPETKAEPKPEAKSAPSSSVMKKALVAGVIVLAVLVVLAIGFVLGRSWVNSKKEKNRLVLYGNVDLRQVELAFNNNERIAEVLYQEGDKVARGQVLARLDTSRLKPQAASAKADMVNASQQWSRLTALAGLTTGRAISQEDLDNAKAASDMAQARLTVADRKLADAELFSPCDAVVRSRLLEPGEMVSPQRPVYNLAITDPKWIRAYVSEADLGKVHPGMKASIGADSFPGRTFPGWVGFISSVAEFTPKAVETVELRSSLVYEIRVFVQDPQDEMRLGMPATVYLELNPSAQRQP